MTINPRIYMPLGMYLSSLTTSVKSEELRQFTEDAESLYAKARKLKAKLMKMKIDRSRLLPSERQDSNGQQLEARIEKLEGDRQELKRQIDALQHKIQSLETKSPLKSLAIDISFPGGWYLVRKITSYPEGYILFSPCDENSVCYPEMTVAELPAIDSSHGLIYRIYVREGDFETLRFSENGDLLENSDTSKTMSDRTKYDTDFIRREMSLDKNFLRQVFSKTSTRPGYQVMDLLKQLPREQGIDLPRHYFECAIVEFVSHDDKGFGSSANRKKWLNNSIKGNGNWNGFALEGIRDRMIKILKHELNLSVQGEKNNYPNKAYKELHEHYTDLPIYLGELAENPPLAVKPVIESYYKGKHSKMTASKEFFTQVEQLHNEMLMVSSHVQRIDAARIIVFAFDSYMKAKKDSARPIPFATYFCENKKELRQQYSETSSLCRHDHVTVTALSSASPKTMLTTHDKLDNLASSRSNDTPELQRSEIQQCATKRGPISAKNLKKKRKRSINQSD